MAPDRAELQYTGRIDFDDPLAPVFIYPYTSVRVRFTGSSLRVLLKNHRAYWDNYIGFIIDGKQDKLLIPENEKTIAITLADNLANAEHDLIFFKRQDACHHIEFFGFAADKDAQIKAPPPKPERRIEVFGDSVSAGEISEAVDYVGKKDPEHNGQYSNSWYSYAAITARKLNAQLHDVAQGGIALLHGTGWFCEPDCVGMEEIYDKLEYNPALGRAKKWDFSRYIPHVVIVAIGQNDSHPEDYMRNDYDGARSKNWLKHYERFVRGIRKLYPKALIILSTTILEHDPSWDRSIDKVCAKTADPRIVRFMYEKNGSGTPGHIRIPEAEKMADELSGFISSFGESVFEA